MTPDEILVQYVAANNIETKAYDAAKSFVTNFKRTADLLFDNWKTVAISVTGNARMGSPLINAHDVPTIFQIEESLVAWHAAKDHSDKLWHQLSPDQQQPFADQRRKR